MQKKLGTASMVTRWRAAHPDLANTDKDLAIQTIQEIREAIGGEELIMGHSCTLLLFKKSTAIHADQGAKLRISIFAISIFMIFLFFFKMY